MYKSDVFEKKTIPQLIFLFSFPSICSLVLESVASMIDTAFAGHLGLESANALSAMGILSPVLALLIAAQLIFGTSTSIVIAKRLGEDNKEKINNTFKVGLYASLVSSAVISLFIFIFQDKLLEVLGATGEVFLLAKEYLNIAIIFNIFSSVGYTLVNNIRTFGHPKIEIIVVVSSTIIHIVVNTIFTFVLDLGLRGIALSTLISELFYFSFSIIFLVKKDLWIKKSSMKIEETKEILLALIKIGFVQFLMQSLNSVTKFITNKVLIQYAAMSYIGAWAICSSIHTVVLLPLIGLTQGIQSIIAYYEGSNDETRKNEAKGKTMKYSLVYSIAMTILVYLFSHNIVKIFTSDSSIIELCIIIIRIVIISFPLMGIIYTLISFMQVLGEEKKASKLGFMRQVLFYIPLIIILPVIFSKYNILNIPSGIAVFLAIPLADLSTVIIYGLVKVRTNKLKF